MSLPIQRAMIKEIRPLTSQVRELILEPQEWPVRFKAGQWITLHLPVGPKPPLIRAYSLAFPEQDDGHLVLTLNETPQGVGSSYLFSCRFGEEVTIAGPFGNFVLPDDLEGKNLVFVARFTGIVPFRCMLLDLFQKKFPGEILLLYGAERTSDFIYGEEFLKMAGHMDFHYLPTLLKPEEGWTGLVGTEAEIVRTEEVRRFVTGKIFTQKGKNGEKSVLPYICGLREMVHPVRDAFLEYGFERQDLQLERYD